MEQNINKLSRLCGISLALAGLLLLFINTVLTPQMLAIKPFTESVASAPYGWRSGLASLTAGLSIIASVGIYILYSNRHPNSWRGIILLISLIVGNSMLLAHEWNQFLFVRQLAISFPDTLDQLNDMEAFNLYDLSATIAVSLYFLGWSVGIIILWLGQTVKYYIALLIIIGLIASPLLAQFIPVVYAGIIASILISTGWFLIARKLYFQ